MTAPSTPPPPKPPAHGAESAAAPTPGRGSSLRPGDQALPGTPGTGEAVCPHCGGSGTVQGKPCPDCGGSGVIVQGIGGA